MVGFWSLFISGCDAAGPFSFCHFVFYFFGFSVLHRTYALYMFSLICSASVIHSPGLLLTPLSLGTNTVHVLPSPHNCIYAHFICMPAVYQRTINANARTLDPQLSSFVPLRGLLRRYKLHANFLARRLIASRICRRSSSRPCQGPPWLPCRTSNKGTKIKMAFR